MTLLLRSSLLGNCHNEVQSSIIAHMFDWEFTYSLCAYCLSLGTGWSWAWAGGMKIASGCAINSGFSQRREQWPTNHNNRKDVGIPSSFGVNYSEYLWSKVEYQVYNIRDNGKRRASPICSLPLNVYRLDAHQLITETAVHCEKKRDLELDNRIYEWMNFTGRFHSISFDCCRIVPRRGLGMEEESE